VGNSFVNRSSSFLAVLGNSCLLFGESKICHVLKKHPYARLLRAKRRSRAVSENSHGGALPHLERKAGGNQMKTGI
jgi:hypothetical protein